MLPMTMLRHRFSAAVFALTALLPFAPAQEATIRVGTWNIEFLGGPPQMRRDTPPRSDDDVAAIGRKVKELGVAALAVQEISGEAVLQQVAAAAGPSWRALLGTTGSWDDGSLQQGTGFLWDDAVLELVVAEERLDFPREHDGVAVFHRKPVTACFRHRLTGTDFRLVTVHLKAGQKPLDKQKRRIEATLLRDWLQELAAARGEDPDIVLLGDFNSTFGDEPEALLEGGGAMQYLESSPAQPTILWFDDPIDQVVVGKGFAEVRRDSLLVHGVAGEPERLAWRKTYSDHFPVTFELRARRDDDPDATFSLGPVEQHLPLAKRRSGSAAPAGPAPAAATDGWPPAVGARVSVDWDGASGVEGTLAAPLPEGPGGWLVIDTRTGRVAVPYRNVRALRIR